MTTLRVAARRIERFPLWILPLAIGILVIFLPYLGASYNIVRQTELSLILCLLVSGLNLSLGYAGELSMGQVAMYAGAAYVDGLINIHGHTDILLQLLVGVVVAMLIGVVSAIPGLRLGSWSLAMTSFFLILLIPDVLQIFLTQTGGPNGLSGMLPATLFGKSLTGNAYFVTIGVVALLWFAVMRNIVVSRHGIALRVLKQSPVLASSLGISVYRMKVLAYALGALPAGLAGALFSNLDQYISPAAFTFTFATTILAASIFGGSASVYGAVIGSFIMQFGLNQSSDYQQYSLVVTGAFLLLGGVLLPGGLASLARSGWRRLAGRAEVDRAVVATKVADFPPMTGAELRVEGISKAFGGNQALSDVDLTAQAGRITALIGPNGSGKTTLLNIICGFYKPDSGQIRLGDRGIARLAPASVARAGITRTFQTPNVPAGISVLDAVTAGRYTRKRVTVLEAVFRLPRFWRVQHEDLDEAWRALAAVGLEDAAYREATSLPLGQRRLLEVARCLVARPGLLLLDEIASGLDEDEVERLAELIRRVAAAGGTVLLVEHNFQLVMSLADEIVALAQGKLMARGTPEEIASNPRVLSEYLGVDQTAGNEEVAELSHLLTDSISGGEK